MDNKPAQDNPQKNTAANNTDNDNKTNNTLNDSAQTDKSASEPSKTADHKTQENKAQDDQAQNGTKKDTTSNKDSQSKKEESSTSDKKHETKDTTAKKGNDKKDDEEVSEQDKKLLGVDIEAILDKEEELKNKLKESSHLERFTTDVSLFISLIKDYYNGSYRKIPYKSISSIVIGLVYILNPVDIIPDFIPAIGYIDDALIIAFCLKMVEKDLLEYQAWKEQQAGDNAKADKPDEQTA